MSALEKAIPLMQQGATAVTLRQAQAAAQHRENTEGQGRDSIHRQLVNIVTSYGGGVTGYPDRAAWEAKVKPSTCPRCGHPSHFAAWMCAAATHTNGHNLMTFGASAGSRYRQYSPSLEPERRYDDADRGFERYERGRERDQARRGSGGGGGGNRRPRATSDRRP